MDITTATPVEIDTKLNGLYQDLARAANRQGGALVQLHRAVGDDTSYRKAKYDLTHQQAIAKAEVQAASDNDFLGAARKGLDALIAAQDGIKQVEDQINPLEAEYSSRPWARAWLVTSSAGHVHRNQFCSTCNIRTGYALMFMFSGQTEAEIVEAAGERACTVCYPTAPAEVLNRPTRMFTPDEVAKAQARAEREEKAAAKATKNITRPDGSPLRNEYGVIKTERAAEIEAVKALADDDAYEFTHPSRDKWLAFVEQAIEALAAKRGVSQDEIRVLIEAKAVAKIARDKKEAAKYSH